MPDIYLLIEGKQEGPYSEDATRQSLAEGLIPADLPAWREGLADWIPINQLLDGPVHPVSAILATLNRRIIDRLPIRRKAFWLLAFIFGSALLLFAYRVDSRLSMLGTYRNVDNTQGFTLHLGSEVEVHTSDGTFLGNYDFNGDSLRIIMTSNQEVDYLTKVPEGWRDQGGTLFLSQRCFNAVQRFKQIDSNDAPDKLIQEYSQVLGDYPRYADAYEARGRAEKQKGDISAATADFNQALKIDPNSEASKDLSEIADDQQQQYTQAWDKLVNDVGFPASKQSSIHGLSLDELTDEETKKPNDPTIPYSLGCICLIQGWYEVAENDLRKAVDLNPKFGDAHFNLAISYLRESPPSRELARQEYQKAIDSGTPRDSQMERLLDFK